MGCDIHAYLEYKFYGNTWDCFAQDIDIDRDYELFGLLADVRDINKAVVSPRGVPETISWKALCDYTYYITDEPYDNSEEVTPKSALEMVTSCHAKYFNEHRLIRPDWHDASWLSLEELKQVFEKYSKSDRSVTMQLKAIIACMEIFQQDVPDIMRTRLVFWFDN